MSDLKINVPDEFRHAVAGRFLDDTIVKAYTSDQLAVIFRIVIETKKLKEDIDKKTGDSPGIELKYALKMLSDSNKLMIKSAWQSSQSQKSQHQAHSQDSHT